MSGVDQASDEMTAALYRQAVVDVISTVGTAVEADEAGVDMAQWIAECSQGWTREHGRAGVMIIGLLMSAAGIAPEALAGIGQALVHDGRQE